MKFVSNISEKEYTKFVLKHRTSHFLKSYEWGDIAKKRNFIPHYVGLKNNNKLVATALLLEKNLIFGYKYYYIPRGYAIDYSDLNLVKTFTKEIEKYCKKNKGIYFNIDPDIKLQNLDINGNKIDGEENFSLVEFLKSIGFKHLGYNKAFEHNQPRYTFRLDLSSGIENITNNFHSTTKKIVNKGNQYKLEIYKNDEKYIDDFYKTMEDTAKREKIIIYPKKYYLDFYKELHKRNHGDIYIAYLNKKVTLDLLNSKMSTLNDEYENLHSDTKKQEIQNQINKLSKLINEIDNVNEEKLVLSSIITAKYGDKIWTIHGGNSSILRELNANYLIYYEIIKDACKEGYKLIDFFGTSYNPSQSDPEYGIYLFKKRLGGEYTEFIGEFTYIVRPFMSFVFNTLIKLRRFIYRLIKK